MTADTEPTTAPLICLPTEIKQLILCCLPDIRTLQALAATHPTFGEAFENHSSFIINQVLIHTIPSPILPEAFSTLASARLQPRDIDKKKVEKVLKDYFLSLEQQSCQHQLTLVDGVALENLHHIVQLFTSNFMETALSLCKVPSIGDTGVESVHVKPSVNETYRFYRAFYRFELYCNLFRGLDKRQNVLFNVEEQWNLFFSHFAPWENEQLACAHDFLLSQITEPFRDVAAHDVAWGEYSVSYLDETEPSSINSIKRYYLSLGLEFIYRLTCTKSYYERSIVLKSNFESQPRFLDVMLRRSIRPYDRVLLSEYDTSLFQHYIQLPAVADPDSGPAEIWKFVYRNASCPRFSMEPGFRPFREWAYVMWDLERLENWESCDGSQGFEAFRNPPPSANFDFDEWDKMRQSMIRRSEIYRDGGHGWWSEDDESKVVYPRGKPEKPFRLVND